MQPQPTPAKPRQLALNRPMLDSLRNAHGIESEADLARHIGVDPATLYRISTGRTKPSNEFMAGIKGAFPLARLDDLFSVIDVLA